MAGLQRGLRVNAGGHRRGQLSEATSRRRQQARARHIYHAEAGHVRIGLEPLRLIRELAQVLVVIELAEADHHAPSSGRRGNDTAQHERGEVSEEAC